MKREFLQSCITKSGTSTAPQSGNSQAIDVGQDMQKPHVAPRNVPRDARTTMQHERVTLPQRVGLRPGVNVDARDSYVRRCTHKTGGRRRTPRLQQHALRLFATEYTHSTRRVLRFSRASAVEAAPCP